LKKGHGKAATAAVLTSAKIFLCVAALPIFNTPGRDGYKRPGMFKNRNMEGKKEQLRKVRRKPGQDRIKNVLRCPMCDSENLFFEAEIKGFLYEHCQDCDVVFSPQITPQFLSKLYCDGFHGPEDGGPKAGWSKNVLFLEPAFKRLPQNRGLQILDFGTGQSLISGVLRKQGHKVIAVDLAPPLRPHPDRLTGNLLDLELQKSQFDLIFAFQVFEHLPRPKPVLYELLTLLKPGGLLLIHTDMETPERDEAGLQNWWYAAPPDHCIFYRHKSFEIFLKNQPAKITWKDTKTVLIKKEGSLKEVVQ
jgi:hypothetical protein